MKAKFLFAAAALAFAGTGMTADAQRYSRDYQPYASTDIWTGAPEGLQQRIDWLQDRINRGVADGSLSRAEANRAQYQLNTLRRDANALGQRLDTLSRGLRWARNNDDYRYGNAVRDPYATDYDAARYYRDDPRYQERRLTAQDEVYRGSDGRYYCKRSDGTTGLVIGGVGGAGLGALVAGGRNGVAGALIGGALGALVGRQIDQNTDIRCR